MEQALIIAAVALALGYLLGLARWAMRWLRGPAADWPLVADRVARGMELREDLDTALDGLRMWVHPVTRARLDVALEDGDAGAHPGAWLALSGVIPRSQRKAFARADPQHLAALLRSVAHRPQTSLLDQALSQAAVVALLAMFAALSQSTWMYWWQKFMRFSPMIQDEARLPAELLWWGSHSAVSLAMALICALLLAAYLQRLGWTVGNLGWRRIASGLVLRRLLASRCDERQMATALVPLLPRREQALAAAASRGDAAGVLAAAGWPDATPSTLDQRLALAVARQERRLARLSVAARIALPVLLAIPIALSSAGVMLAFAKLDRAMLRTIPLQDGGCSGGTVASALLYWWCVRDEHAGDEAVRELKALRAPLLKTILPTMPKKGKARR